MDIVLSVFDTFIADYAYAAAFPRQEAVDFGAAGNATSIPLAQPKIELDPISEAFNWQPSSAAYASSWDREYLPRQFLSFFVIMNLFGLMIYFVFASLSYLFIFDKTTFQHPKWLKNQIRQEITQTVRAIPGMSVLTVPFFVAEVHGYAKLYQNVDDYGWWYMIAQFPIFIAFTDFGIYWIHRFLHSKMLYRHLHKPHHKWIMPSPYASHAFHPVDGWLQSVPYHVFPFILPLHKYSYIILFTFINIWTVAIHDGEYMAMSPVINGAACHTMHHLYFNYNYGQFTTLWDRLGGSYRKPNLELFYKETKMSQEAWAKQKKEMEQIVKEVEGDDSFREYEGATESKKAQ